ncbi:GGDEF domain-containing protein [Pseudoalteromonas tunicata]|jgi:diguanylate cyclase (GGDEF)-like protein|uniref:diguanylate cyclase n=1 Tax=Pseudoalteromonas tunicata D2 TaxID=87626 RepID=A4C4L5_9GAMM|nr:GGDEF domain-containing protein [Pseudoalteromonas tunicata]ATC97023.1 hypothetical protein PTUN_b0676 [Pseudoalteromonas tunicata]AXT33143.1 GGDEF domain-containing protein [Pseudoalteromonas tunicata]EAR30497.1 hypothetical protein PTD2_02971 [Pseudoalteromonas tunicata D2]
MSKWHLHTLVWLSLLIAIFLSVQQKVNWAQYEEIIWFGIYLSFFIEICACVKKPFFIFSFSVFSFGLILDILDSFLLDMSPLFNLLDTPIKHVGLILLCYCLLKIAKSRLNKIKQLHSEINQRIKLEKELRFLAYHDELTGLFNRRAFFEHYELKQFNQAFLYYFDLNNFKHANDKYGHNIGDEILVLFSSSLNTLYPNDSAYRLGGDEFVLITDIAIEDMSVFKTLLDKPLLKYMVSVSVGCHQIQEDDDPDHALHLADQHMYLDKEEHRNSFIVKLLD